MHPENEYQKKMKQDDINVLTCESPVPLLTKLHDGELSRFDCWNILCLIHQGEFKCNLPQYGTLTVFSLAKDMVEFSRLYDQGISMLRENGQVTPDEEELLAEETYKEIKKAFKTKKVKINPNNNRLN